MSPRILRLALVAALGLWAWTSSARADEAATDATPRHWRPFAWLHQPPPADTPCAYPLRSAVQGQPCGCWANFNGYSCGSLQSECDFLFGSCRTFFGEPCTKSPPPLPWEAPAAGGTNGCRSCGRW